MADHSREVTAHLRRALDGQADAMDALFRVLGPLIEQVARCRLGRSVGHSDGWEEVASRVALGLLGKLRRGFHLEDGMSGQRALLALVSKITSDVVIDRLRTLYRKGRIRERSAPGDPEEGEGMDAFSASVTTAWRKEVRREDVGGLRAALDELAERDRLVLVLRGMDGIPFKTVGSQLGISEDAARMAFTRALERLRHVLPPDLAAAFATT